MILWLIKSRSPGSLGARRSYWTATTFRSGSAINLVNAVEQAISSFTFPSKSTRSSRVLLFALPKHLPSELLARLVNKFQSLVPSLEPIGVLAQDSTKARFSVSIATWSGLSDDLVPFTSTVASRTPIAVGREIIPPSNISQTSSQYSASFLLPKDYQGEAHDINESPHSDLLPIELKNIPSNSIKNLIFFSAPSPQPFLKTLEQNFPSANLMGLIGSSTIFQTGRRSTLFRNRSITGEEGAVGIAVLDGTNHSFSISLIRYPGMEVLGSPMQVTQSKGNIILTLNSQKATGCLLQIIQKSNRVHQFTSISDSILTKNKPFYLGFLDDDNKLIELNRITGGSVSRGTISLDREREIPINQLVQFVHFPQNSDLLKPKKSISSETKSNKARIEFQCNKSFDDHHDLSQENPIRVEKDGNSVEKIDGLFSAGSEFGFIPRHQQIVDINCSDATLELNCFS